MTYVVSFQATFWAHLYHFPFVFVIRSWRPWNHNWNYPGGLGREMVTFTDNQSYVTKHNQYLPTFLFSENGLRLTIQHFNCLSFPKNQHLGLTHHKKR